MRKQKSDHLKTPGELKYKEWLGVCEEERVGSQREHLCSSSSETEQENQRGRRREFEEQNGEWI